MGVLRIVAILVSLLVALPCFGATKYMVPGGAGAKNGTSWTNAWDANGSTGLSPGDIVYMAGGSYTNGLTMANSGNADTAGGTIFFKRVRSTDSVASDGDWNAAFDAQVQLPAINFNSKNYVTVDGRIANGIQVDMTPSLTYGAALTGAYNKVYYTKVVQTVGPTAFNPFAFVMSGTNGLIDHAYVYGTCFGFNLSGTDNVLQNSEASSLQKLNAKCGDVDYCRIFGTRTIARNNYFHGVDVASLLGLAHVDCFQSYDNNGEIQQNITIEQNFCADAHEGVEFSSITHGLASGLTIRNNVFIRCSAYGADVWGVKNYKAFNNTVDVRGGLHGLTCRTGSECEIKNNIIVGTSGPPYWKDADAAWVDGDASAPGKNNVLYRPGVTITGYANDTINQDPLFISSVAENYRLQSNSPAINAGADLTSSGVTVDKDGTSRPQGAAFDSGAYEYAEASTYIVTASAGSHTSISPSGAREVSASSQPTFTVTADNGYTLSVAGTCGGSLAGSTYTTNAVTADCTVTASATEIKYAPWVH